MKTPLKFLIALGVSYLLSLYLEHAVTQTRRDTIKNTVKVCVQEPQFCRKFYDGVIMKEWI
jgi:hypothetical protein